MNTQTCRVCGEDKSLDSFEYRKDNDKLRTECRDCRHLAVACQRYGITPQHYRDLLASQDHRCAICKVHVDDVEHATFKRLVVDHCHRTHRVRGLLCARCNIAIGQLDDSVQKLHAAIQYLS